MICTHTHACALRKFNVHPNYNGHKLIADTFFAALRQHRIKAG